MFTSGKWIRGKERAHHSLWKFVTFIAFEFTGKICFQTTETIGSEASGKRPWCRNFTKLTFESKTTTNIHANLVRPVSILKMK